MKHLLFLFACCFFCWKTPLLQAQEYNKTDASGNRVGYWIIKTKDDKLLAKGRYNDAGQREGEWKFYLSPVSRYTGDPDVTGSYEAGIKQGKWQVVESRSKNRFKGFFENGKMSGVWILYDAKDRKLAKGEYLNDLRHGRWIIYHYDQPMDMGLYEYGEKVGTWYQDVYLDDSTVHVKGVFNYSKSRQEGSIEIFKVEKSKSFGMSEYLVGTGTYLNGKKSGRWIEYKRGLKGESIETGYYAGNGEREGVWESVVNGRSYQHAAFSNGLRQGAFKTFHDNGQVKYETYFDKGLEVGLYKSYYENGQLREQGGYTILERNHVEDTVFYKIELPIEYHFRLVDLDNLEDYNYNAIKWIRESDFSIAADELERRFREFLSYGKNKELRVQEIIKTSRQSAKSGRFVSYYENGKVRAEGAYYPEIQFVRDPATNSETKEFAKDGEWKEYDDQGFLKWTSVYDQGKLLKKYDAQGKEVDLSAQKGR